ncbi:UbiA family prenyltransferase [Hymenobacter sp. CRA2]|uniref:UbiA family prenyltransferase n=1 Tax=Hymenobacter sp. CRA2 TaxID=1955620 RepID=UPI0009CBEF44|nr:UbiA family prenyltransferase [Hymenobacter sp. CRA2]OON67170.1 hypothetical protein B0919_18755 [Hymenobacter sp. CRA2]
MARANEWWAFKFSPLLGTAYATAWVVGASGWALLPRLLLLLAALAVGAAYVSLINDWTDRRDDAAAGKPNGWTGRSGTFAAAAFAGCLGPGLGFGWYFWQLSPAAGLLYLGAWVVYTLYSVPPVRLKTRGLPGLLADAAGAHFFPQLLTATLIAAWAARPLPAGWLLALGAWSLTSGVRNIIGHQLSDATADAHAGVATFVQRRGVAVARMVGQGLAFPVEVLSFGALLWLSQALLPGWLLVGYAALEWFRQRVWNVRLAVVEWQPRQRPLLNEYYEVFYPLAFLVLLGARHSADFAVLGLHALLFGPHLWHTAHSLAQVASVLAHKLSAR